jgi:TonB family protein
MLQKERSNQTAMMKYGLIAPLFMLMIVVSSATLASKQLNKIEEKVEELYEENLEEIIVKPSKIVSEVLLEENLDLSKALIISPDLVDEVKAIQESKRDSIYDGVDQQAEYPGGMGEFSKFLQQNIKYPASSQKANHAGKVYVQFIVNTDGSASDFSVLKSTGDNDLDNEALRVLKLAKWNSGKHGGINVRSRFTVPINFELDGEPKLKINKNDNEEFPKLPAVMEFKAKDGTIINNRNIVIMDKSKTSLGDSKKLIYMMDGKRISEIELKGIEPNDIEKLDVYKGENAVMRYGEDAREGAIVITLKKK